MASWGVCDISKLKAMADQFHNAMETKAGENFTREVLLMLAKNTFAKIKERTPANTGKLRKGWTIGEVVQNGDMFEIEIVNNAKYASFAEHGNYNTNSRTLGDWHEGNFMLKTSVDELVRLAPAVIGGKAEVFLDRLLGGI